MLGGCRSDEVMCPRLGNVCIPYLVCNHCYYYDSVDDICVYRIKHSPIDLVGG